MSLDQGSIINGIVSLPKERSTWSEFAVVVTHGAGGDMNIQQLKELSQAVARAGLVCLRFTCKTPNFGHRVRCFAAAVRHLKTSEEFKVKGCIVGGRSMGGRVAAELATLHGKEDPFVLGVFCLSYPLHRPKRYNDLRVAHLIHLSVPVMFVSGTKDPMCRMDLMESTIDRIGSDVRVHWLHDADHSLNLKGKCDDEILAKICEWTISWIQSVFMAER
ncbi:testis-expressed protein 30-like isoform X2 [Rhopilema esculentum]|eukprot:gene2539-734_t